ncbi:acetyl-CoA carboxylase / biotin carboxylase 1 [Nematocida homosporus]|uniref:acetyl-CoA carboxylase / biotin carboxylase 1 n=1 Tax=Nematocida homosporus TaxID=1912981 RepID=UPI00221E9ABD|nr:acetyl-CoA carboxylase / biotin carboxylase 1 [Nematocida homosporus]KAI5186383.1 acetyl-CoA carboxylase / biotin carboxylase 1 [Nematocida homosporus]
MLDRSQKIEQFISDLGGVYDGHRIFVANNSLAALKFILSMNDFSFRKFGRGLFEFYGLARPSDRSGESKYLDLLTDYAEVEEEDPRASFKNPEVICQLARQFGCRYVWPGWGHASEDPELPRACTKYGLLFLGPSAAAMAAVGGKISANELADASGVESIPWMEVVNLSEAVGFCQEIKYPVMAKTPEGGGGKGIRLVEKEDDLAMAIEIVKKETCSERVFLTKYLADIKHIELQVVADSSGDVEVLSSRDCTVQRRNQKLIEEGPADISEEVLKEIREKSKILIRKSEYQGVCTMEFVYDRQDKKMYFLEANPRLQVEHTVTELIGGANLCAVQWMIGCGAKLALIKQKGLLGNFTEQRHVVAARVVAECAQNKFAPSTGSVSVSAVFPSGTVGYFAVDKGEIGPYNDSQFGHVFGIGVTREEAIDSLKMVLSSIRISGEAKNLNHFLLDLISSEVFRDNQHNTKYAEEFRKSWVQTHSLDPFYLLAFVAIYAHQTSQSQASVVFKTCGVEVTAAVSMIDKTKSTITYAIRINQSVSVLEIISIAKTKYRIKTNQGEAKTIYFSETQAASELICEGKSHIFLMGQSGNSVQSTLFGRVVRFLKSGPIKKNEEFVEIESMKNIIRCGAPREGTLVEKVQPGDLVKVGQTIAEIHGETREEDTLVYKEAIEYANVQKDFTMNLFSQYSIPSELLLYTADSLAAVLQQYSHTPAHAITADLDNYLIKALKRLIESKTEIKLNYQAVVQARYIVSTQSRASSATLLSMLQQVAVLIEAQERRTLLSQTKNLLAQKGNSYLLSKEALQLPTEIIIALSLLAEYQQSALILWIKKVFQQEGSPEDKGGVSFYWRSTQALVTTSYTETPPNQALFLIQPYPSAVDTQYFKNTILIQVHEDLSISYQTHKDGQHLVLYDELDPAQIERVVLPSTPKLSLFGVFWARKVFLYTSEHYVRVHGMLTPEDFMAGAETFATLLQEIRVAYKLSGSNALLDVSILISAPLALTKTALADYLKTKIIPQTYPIDDFFLNSITISGSILSEDENQLLTPPTITTSTSTTSPSEQPTNELCVFLRLSTNRGFKECVLFINYQQVFYLIDTLEIKNAQVLTQSTHQDNPLNSDGTLSNLMIRRKQALSLDTSYIYDLVSLLDILLREMHPNARIEEIKAQESCAMKAWLATRRGADLPLFILVANDITDNYGAFSINEDVFFTQCATRAQALSIPFIYISSNSGAKIEVMESLKPIMKYNPATDTLYLEEADYTNLVQKDEIEVLPKQVDQTTIYEIVGVLGKYGMGVENLSYSAEIAKTMSRIHKLIPTITYATGRAVGIGAYLARLGGRVIQKQSAPIILTGFQALNKLLQKTLYTNNLQIGGPDILTKNGTVHRVVKTETEGIHEILQWLEFILTRHFPTALIPNAAVNSRPLNTTTTTTSISPTSTSPTNTSLNTNPNLTRESFTPEEIIALLSDQDSFIEYLSEWAPNVQTGRARMNGHSYGVVFPRSSTVTTEIPSNSRQQIIWTQNVLLPETSKKIAQAIKEFSVEGLPILMLVHWRGFTAGHLDMFEGALQHGAAIVTSMEEAQVPIFVYLGPNAELRGGSWVVFDKRISEKVFFAAHSTGTGSVMHPDGLATVKFKQPEIEATLTRSQAPITNATKMRLGHKFCALHDTATRMLKMKVIDKIVPITSLKQEILTYFTNATSTH